MTDMPELYSYTLATIH